MNRRPRIAVLLVLCLPLCLAESVVVGAPPTITNISLRGLQIGGTTTLVVEGTELLPNPVFVAPFPIASQSIKGNPQSKRIEIDVQIPAETTPGLFQVRVANSKGISNPVVVGLDRLPQLPFSATVANLPVALHGNLTGPQILLTKFHGTKGQRIVVDVEARRLGASLQPIVRIQDAAGRQVAWSPARISIAGDARAEVTLPADGEYRVELHDLLFRGAAPGFFRLKIGELHFADLAFPLGIQVGTKAPIHFALTNVPGETTVEMDATSLTVPTSGPTPVISLPKFTGGQPQIAVSQHAEAIESAAADGTRQVLPAAPVAVSGRLSQPKQEDQFAIPVKPGNRLRIEVFGERIGSPVDGVLSVRTEAGVQIATNDDRPGNPDPGLELQVPENTNQIVVALRDLIGRGGEDFVYRVEITDAAAPDFSVTADSDRFIVPAEATQTILVKAVRTNYAGPIKFEFSGLPSHVQVAGSQIAAGASLGLVTVSAGPGAPTSGLIRIIASSAVPEVQLQRPLRSPENQVTKHFPWLREEFAFAVSEPAPVRIAWAGPTESPMLLGDKLPLTVSLTRSGPATGSVRLRLLTTQVMPRKKVKENKQEKEVDDIDRALRLDGDVVVAPDAVQATPLVIVPADLAAQDWGLVLAADLLAADNKTVVATTTTTAISKRPIVPFVLELASQEGLEAKAGLGATGKLTGKLKREPGFTKPVVLSLSGLPKEYPSPQATVPADKEDFEFSVSFAFGTKPAELKEAKLVAHYQPDPKQAELVVRSEPVAVGIIKVVPGEPPPSAPTLTIFEDDEKFVSYLSKGDGQIALETQDKYSGTAAVKVTPNQRYNETVPNLNVKIREKPAAGEYRFLRFAWKKKGGEKICLQLNHDGAWGVGGSGKPGAKFRYHAGPGGECYEASVAVDEKLPTDFVVVTRDLFADFGEFTLTGIAFSPVDGEYALFDHLHLGRAAADLDTLKPAK